jgi:hypothetical protein
MDHPSHSQVLSGVTRVHLSEPSTGRASHPERDVFVKGPPRAEGAGVGARTFLDRLVGLGLLPSDAVGPFLGEREGRLSEYATDEQVGRALVQAGLLTSYQLDRVLAGTTHGLILGNYRVLDALGSGGMGVVFLAEHGLMKRRVAV